MSTVCGPDEADWQIGEFGDDGEGGDAVAMPTVAIVGRPNVGKSTLVNRILGRREAVVEDIPGVTRDRVSYAAVWSGRRFLVQDTGGWEPDAKGMGQAIARQAEFAMNTADAVVLVVDATVGATATDEAVARVLRRSKTPVLLAANKVRRRACRDPRPPRCGHWVSANRGRSRQRGRGAGDLLDAILEVLPETPRESFGQPAGPRRVALVGKPNVGKSSLLNKLTDSDRAVVDNVAGTTVDPVDELVELGGRLWNFVDTAGLRKRVNTASGHEYYASLRTRAAIDAAEVAVLLIDASEPITEQDSGCPAMIVEAGRSLVIAFNKWDLVDEDRRLQLDQGDRPRPGPGALGASGQHLCLDGTFGAEARPAARHRAGLVGQAHLHRSAQRLAQGHHRGHPASRSRRSPAQGHVRGQAATRPPTFVLFTTGFLEAGYRRFLERKLREQFGFDGSPVRINVRVREKRERRK